LWKYCLTRNQATHREVGEFGFLFYFILFYFILFYFILFYASGPPMPVPIPAINPNPTSKGMNWIALFDSVWAISGMGRL
jgi:hypothetical protein